MSVMNIKLRHVRCFVAVAMEKSFARAAERLAVSQPALSQTITQLEATLGFPVFERTTRSVKLTATGQLLFESATKLNTAMDTFYCDIKSLQVSVVNEVRLGYLIGTAVDFMPDIVSEFERRRPHASLRLVEFDFNNPDAGLASKQVDCGIFRPPLEISDIQVVELAREKCVVCLPTGHALAQQKSVRMAQLLDEPFIAAPKGGVWRDFWLANDFRDGKPPKVAFEAATVDAELQAVATRKGISITAESTAKYYARPGVVFLPIQEMAECSIAIGFGDSSNSLVMELVEIAQAVARRYLPAGVAGDGLLSLDLHGLQPQAVQSV